MPENDLSTKAREYRDACLRGLTNQLNERGWQAGESLNEAELELVTECESLNDRVAAFECRDNADANIVRRFGDPSTRTSTMKESDARDLTYRKGDPRYSWIRDVAKAQILQDGESRSRLQTHAAQVAEHPAFMEYRDISRVDGEGGWAVPPAWLMSDYVELARSKRAFANSCQLQPLPGGTDSINIPKLLTGTAVGIQTADNTAIADVDLTDTFINAPVRTIAGQQGISLQLVDQSPLQFDQIVFDDLIKAYATQVDLQVLSGNGTSGQVLGLDYTAGISTIAVSSVTIQGIYTAIANAIQQIHTTRFEPPEVIFMHPRRWGWILSLLDTTDRPLVLPYANNPMNSAGVLTQVASQQIVGQMHGLPVVTDPNITTTNGSESPVGTEDVIIVAKTSDSIVWENPVHARVLPETKAMTLTLLVQVYGYLAVTHARYPQSYVQITGLTPPSW